MGLLSFWVLAHDTTPISSTPPRSGRRPMLRSARRRLQLQQCPAARHAASRRPGLPPDSSKAQLACQRRPNRMRAHRRCPARRRILPFQQRPAGRSPANSPLLGCRWAAACRSRAHARAGCVQPCGPAAALRRLRHGAMAAPVPRPGLPAGADGGTGGGLWQVCGAAGVQPGIRRDDAELRWVGCRRCLPQGCCRSCRTGTGRWRGAFTTPH